MGTTPAFIKQGNLSMIAAAATAAWLLVTMDTSAQAVIAGATDADNIIGVSADGAALGGKISVRPINDTGTFCLTASVAIVVGDRLYPAASGKVTNVANGPALFIAKTAAAADGERIEAIRAPVVRSAPLRVTPTTANGNLTASQAGSLITNTGAAGAVRVVLPVGTVGMVFDFAVGTAQSFTVGAQGGDVVSLPDTGVPGVANKGLVNAGTIGVFLRLVCTKAGVWSFGGGNAKVGIWTAEP